jgi:hypothetical protein
MPALTFPYQRGSTPSTTLSETPMTQTPVKSVFDLYATNSDDEENGRWFSSFGPGLEFKVRRYSSKKAQAVRTALEKPYLRTSRNNTLSNDIQEEILLKHLAEGVVVDWRGPALVDKTGAPMAFSPKAAYTLFKQLPDLARDIVLVSVDMDRFKDEHVTAMEGNSAPA